MTEKQRISLPDSIKGTAVLLMIQVHLLELFAKQEVFDSLGGNISLFFGGIPAAPIFMLLMGYFLAFSKKSASEMALRGMRLFLGGILLNVGLNLHLLYKIFFENWEINPLQYIFGADILTLAGLSLLSFAAIQKAIRPSYLKYFFLAIVIALGSHFLYPDQFQNHPLRYVFSFLVGGTSWSFFPLIPWLSYPLIGFGCKLLSDKYDISSIINKPWSKYIIGALILLLALSINFELDISTNLPEYYHFNIGFFLWSLAFIIVWIYVLYYVEKWFCNTYFVHYIQFLGKNVTVVYVFQWLIIGNIATSVFKSKSAFEWALWFVIVTISASILTYFWVKLRSVIAAKKTAATNLKVH